MQAAHRVIRNTGFLYARMGLTMFISLYSTRILLQSLGASDFGIYNVVGGAIAMLTFLNAAMTVSTQRFLSFALGEGKLNNLKNIFNVSVVLHFGIALLILIVLEIVGVFLFNGILQIPSDRIAAAKLVFQFLIVSTFFTVMSVPYDGVINAHENMLLVSVLGVLETLIKLGIALFVAYTQVDKLVIYGLLMASMTIILLIIRQVYCVNKYEEVVFNPKKYFSKKMLLEMSSFAGWNTVGNTVSIVTQYGQGILLNSFFGVKINAAQGISNQISGQLLSFSNNMIKALQPQIVKSEGEGNRSRMLKVAITGSKFSYYLIAIFAVPFMIEMPYLLKLWLNEVPEYAIIFAQLLLARNMVDQLFVPIKTTINAKGRIKEYQIATSLLTLSVLIFSYLLFKKGLPPYSLYIVFLIVIIIRTFGLMLYFSNKFTGLDIKLFYKESVLPCIFATLVATVVCLIPFSLMSFGLLRIIVVFIVYIIFFILAVFFLGLNIEEKQLFINVRNIIKTKFLFKSLR